MQTLLYAVSMHTTLLDLVKSMTSGGMGGALTVLAIVVAWLLIGSAIAWAIGNASDLGESSEE